MRRITVQRFSNLRIVQNLCGKGQSHFFFASSKMPPAQYQRSLSRGDLTFGAVSDGLMRIHQALVLRKKYICSL